MFVNKAVVHKTLSSPGVAPRRLGVGGRSAAENSVPTPTVLRCACGGSCPRCKGEDAPHSALPISQPSDSYESEAEAIAARIMSGDPPTARNGIRQRKSPNSETVTRENSAAPPIVHDVLRSPGQPLDTATRAFMEPRFGHDFGAVRVHVDSQAAESADAINARAYTIGRNVVFGASQYQPEKPEGGRLLAHELTHVVQQQGMISPTRSSRGRRADFTNPIISTAPIGVQRQSVLAEGDPEKKTQDGDKLYGPVLLPEVVITATRSYPVPATPGSLQASQNLAKFSVREVTFVKLDKVEDLQQRIRRLNQEAENELRESFLRAQGTLKDASPGADQRAADAKAQAILRDQFGDGWGTFFWWTRGGGQNGEDSPLWGLLEGISGFNRMAPIPLPGLDPVYRDRARETQQIESGR
jgi:uncharacterized protein DUF4157